MSTVYVRTRKYQTLIDCHFFVRDAGEVVMLDNYHINDTVTILFRISPDKAEAINELCATDEKPDWAQC